MAHGPCGTYYANPGRGVKIVQTPERGGTAVSFLILFDFIKANARKIVLTTPLDAFTFCEKQCRFEWQSATKPVFKTPPEDFDDLCNIFGADLGTPYMKVTDYHGDSCKSKQKLC